ncbi:recombinase family protein [Amycolatopsis japonica]
MKRDDKVEKTALKRSVYLLRVSDKKQMYTAMDIDPEGNSIPTQREWCDKRNRELKALKVDEYIEPGYSGQEMNKRPIFKQLLKRIIERRDVDYVVIYMRSRIFRNYIEAAIVKQQLDQLGVKLVSARENFGEGYLGEGMEAIVDVMNWMDVRRNGEDIKVKMLNKVKNGGTNGRARLGYINTTAIIDGHKVNTIAVDEERSKYVKLAFELFSTGKYNVDDLRDKLTDLGLRMPRTNEPISRQTLYARLRDRYYLGYVIHKGMEYPGRHPKLVTEELFDKVQRVLESHSGSGVRHRKHHHYLKGTIWCDRCKQRFMVQRAQGRTGGVYFYFFCGGREDKVCEQPYIPINTLEAAVEAHYGRVLRLSSEFRTAVRDAIDTAVATSSSLSDDMRAEFERRLAKLERKEDYFLELAGEEDWPKDKLRAKVQALRAERQNIRRQLDQAEAQLEAGRQVFYMGLNLLERPQAAYLAGSEEVRTVLNQAFFTRLYVDVEDDVPMVTSHELTEPFGILWATYAAYEAAQAVEPGETLERGSGKQAGAALDEYGACDARLSLSEALDRALRAEGSSTSDMVGPERLELSLART